MDSNSAKILAVIGAVLLVANTAGVAFLLAERLNPPPENSPAVLPPPTLGSAIPADSFQVATVSADQPLAASIADLQRRVLALEGENGVPASQSVPASTAKIRESYLYLGSGSTYNREWSTIDSAAVTIDTAQYGEIIEVRFEAALSIISGEVYARLAEKGTSVVYYGSQLVHNKSNSEWKTSAPLNLLAGKHTYLVQLRSSNGEKANLDGARIKILAR